MFWHCWWFRNPKQPLFGCIKPWYNMGWTINLNWWTQDCERIINSILVQSPAGWFQLSSPVMGNLCFSCAVFLKDFLLRIYCWSISNHPPNYILIEVQLAVVIWEVYASHVLFLRISSFNVASSKEVQAGKLSFFARQVGEQQIVGEAWAGLAVRAHDVTLLGGSSQLVSG